MTKADIDRLPGVTVSFSKFEARGERLSKLYELGANNTVIKTGGTNMSKGTYETITIEAADPPAVLAELGAKLEVLNFREAIGLGVVRAELPLFGEIIVKELYEKIQAKPRATRKGIPRAKSHFVWPAKGLGLLLLDGDERDNLHETLTELFPPFAEVAGLVRPSASASVKDPATGERLKAGEHVFVLLDDPSKARECLHAIRRLAWCIGSGRSAGWISLAKDGDPLPYGPCDTTVGSPERLVYEGEVSIGKGIERLPRKAVVIGGNGVLCAAELLTFADQHAPVAQYNELVEAAKNEPAFLEKQAAIKAAYRAEKIEEGVAQRTAQGKSREEAEKEVTKEFDRVTQAKAVSIGGRIWRELSPHHVLYRTDGTPFLVSDMVGHRDAFHKKECADPVEGLKYQSRNPGLILFQDTRIVIYSRAHSDAYAYFFPLFDTGGDDNDDESGGNLAGLINSLSFINGNGSGAGGGGSAGASSGGVAPEGVRLSDFYAYMPLHNYMFAPAGDLWPGESVNARVPPVPMFKKNGAPLLNEDGKQRYQAPSSWLAKHRAVEQMTWAPGLPQVVSDQLIAEGGWFPRKKCHVFNLYKPPLALPAARSAEEPTVWLDHVRLIYPDDHGHIIPWLAHRKQKPEEKINHSLVLGGAQGIGKDTILVPVRRAVGPWNFKEVSPKQAFGRFNPFLKAVILRINEARDLGEYDRFAFYDHLKVFNAAPPEVLPVDEKNLREHYIVNVVGVIITTNHKSNGIFLPADDRRHYVAWSNFTKDMFDEAYWNEIWKWYAEGGIDIVARYLMNYDLKDFDPKAPPPQTEAFWEIVNASATPEDAEMADALDAYARKLEKARLIAAGVEEAQADAQAKATNPERPDAVTIKRVSEASPSFEFRQYLQDRKNSRKIPHRFESCGYTPVRSHSKDGQWVLNGRRQAIYALTCLSIRQRFEAAQALEAASAKAAAERAEADAKAKAKAKAKATDGGGTGDAAARRLGDLLGEIDEIDD